MTYRTVLVSRVGGETHLTGRGHHTDRDEAVANAMSTHFEFTQRLISHTVRIVDERNEQVFVVSPGSCGCHPKFRRNK